MSLLWPKSILSKDLYVKSCFNSWEHSKTMTVTENKTTNNVFWIFIDLDFKG
jgi:hypothetical protein